MRIVRGKRKKNRLLIRLVILPILFVSILKIVQQRIKIMKLKEENKKISAIISNS